MTDPAPQPEPAPPNRLSGTARRSFPLVALFQLATFCAALMACIDGAAMGKLLDGMSFASSRRAMAVVAATVIAGGLLGLFVALGQFGMWRSAAKGSIVGALGGAAILCVYVAPASIERTTAAAAVLLLSTLVVRARAA